MLSPIIRRAWDGDKLTTLTKTSPLKATGAHISIIGHITKDELKARLTRTDIANGFIRAEVIRWDELLEIGSWTKAREQGKLRVEGKDYEVVDGDVLEIRFNV